jgi:hypothetical protein
MLGRWFFLAVVAIGLAAIVRAPHKSAGATITQACSESTPGAVQVTFAWKPPPAGTQQARLDLSLAPGFLPAVTNGNGPLPPSQLSYTIDALPEGVKVYYRVNTLSAAGWTPVASGLFEPRCAAATPTPAAPALPVDAALQHAPAVVHALQSRAQQ